MNKRSKCKNIKNENYEKHEQLSKYANDARNQTKTCLTT